jgi:hypothetical protein
MPIARKQCSLAAEPFEAMKSIAETGITYKPTKPGHTFVFPKDIIDGLAAT